MRPELLIEAGELAAGSTAVIFDCRFSLADAEAGRNQYQRGHIPGAHYLHLNENLSAPVGEHGGRHPLPDPVEFSRALAAFGVAKDTDVIAYDDSRFAFAARLWWLMDSLGYRPPRLLNGGYRAYLECGGEVSTETPVPTPVAPAELTGYRQVCDIEDLRKALVGGAVLVDSREEARYQGLEEPIDPVAGHIPGAINRPWQGVTTDSGAICDEQGLRTHWGEALDAAELVVYCGSGVTACVNIFALRTLGRSDATLYAGSWSDWCSYL